MIKLNFTGSSELSNRYNSTFIGHTNLDCQCSAYSNRTQQQHTFRLFNNGNGTVISDVKRYSNRRIAAAAAASSSYTPAITTMDCSCTSIKNNKHVNTTLNMGIHEDTGKLLSYSAISDEGLGSSLGETHGVMRAGDVVIGNWDCTFPGQCCMSSGESESIGDYLIHFSGEKGANIPTTACPVGKTCWLNFGGGNNAPINVHDYYSCPTGMTDADCKLGKGTQTDALKTVLALQSDKNYTGVTFDYESDDASVPSISEWTGLNIIFQNEGWKTGLTMGQAGLGIKVKYGLKSDDDEGRALFLGFQVPFSYNIPQLYGGATLDTFFYTGEKNPKWAANDFTGYGVGGDTPLLTLAANVNPNTVMLPSFGAQPPTGGLARVSELCKQGNGAICGDETSFISWNINDPNSTGEGCGGNACQTASGSCSGGGKTWCTNNIPKDACDATSQVHVDGFNIGSFTDGYVCKNLQSCCDNPDKFLQCKRKNTPWSSTHWCTEKDIQTVCAGGKWASKSQELMADTVCRFQYYDPPYCGDKPN